MTSTCGVCDTRRCASGMTTAVEETRRLRLEVEREAPRKSQRSKTLRDDEEK